MDGGIEKKVEKVKETEVKQMEWKWMDGWMDGWMSGGTDGLVAGIPVKSPV